MHPRTRRRDLNRKALLSTDVQEFFSCGLCDARSNRIVVAADLTRPLLYRLWKSKEQAVCELLWSSQVFLRRALKEHMVHFARPNSAECFLLGTQWLTGQTTEHDDLVHFARQHLLFGPLRRRDFIEGTAENFQHIQQQDDPAAIADPVHLQSSRFLQNTSQPSP